MDFWVRLTISEHGRDEDNGSRLIEGLEAVAPGADPLVDQNLADGRLSGSFPVEARDAEVAVERARPIFSAALDAAGLPMTRLVGIEVRPDQDDALAAPAA